MAEKLKWEERIKKTKGADLVISDDIDLPYSNKIPMWMVGLVF